MYRLLIPAQPLKQEHNVTRDAKSYKFEVWLSWSRSSRALLMALVQNQLF